MSDGTFPLPRSEVNARALLRFQEADGSREAPCEGAVSRAGTTELRPADDTASRSEVSGGPSTRSRSEPAPSPCRRERHLVRGELSRRPYEPRCRLFPAEEVGLDHADYPAAEFDVAGARALVGPLEHLPVEARFDVVGHNASGSLREDAGLRHGQTGDVSHGIDLREAGRQV